MPSAIKSGLRIALMTSVVLLAWKVTSAAPDNGFDLGNASIDRAQIMHGGPGKDGIPAIDQPSFIAADSADYLQADDRILGIDIDGTARAYPIAILNWHEIVNDRINDQAFAVTYCPLCGTGVAFSSDVGNYQLDFGVSGLLYNSDVLLYDRQTESLWSQIKSEAVSGKLVGRELERLPLAHTTWADWRQQYPKTTVLSTDTGYSRDYQRDPYDGYAESRATYFQVSHQAPPAYHPKERVLGVELNGNFRAYPFIELQRAGQPVLQDDIDGERLTIRWDAEHRSASAHDARGQPIAAIEGFWFAWFTFHPQTTIFKAAAD